MSMSRLTSSNLCVVCQLAPPLLPRQTKSKQLPKGPAPKKNVGLSPLARYKARYFDGENASGAPFLHVIGGLFLIGYTIDCAFPFSRGSARLFCGNLERLQHTDSPTSASADNMHLKHHKK
jgi:hypothetical protein